MSGTVFKRGKIWAYVINVGTVGVDGARKQRKKGGFTTKRDAERALREVQRLLDARAYVAPSQQTLADFLRDEWLAAMQPPLLRDTTWIEYRRKINDHVIPRIGDTKLQALSPTHLNRLYADLLREGREDGTGGLAPKTVREVHVILHKTLKDAARWGRLDRNVAALADPPSGRAAAAMRRRAMRVWTSDELRQFLQHVRDDPLYSAWLLAATTGMRRSELCGLRWADVDLGLGRLAVRQRLASVDGHPQLSEPKSNRSGRTIDLDRRTVSVLDTRRAAQRAQRAEWGPAWHDLDLVVTREDGHWIHPDWITEMFRRHVRRAGLPRIRLHDLRHTHASLLLASGTNPKIVSERLGHHSVAFTLDTYAHVLPGMQSAAAQALSDALFRDDEDDHDDTDRGPRGFFQ